MLSTKSQARPLVNIRQINLEIVRAGFAEPLGIPPDIQYLEVCVQAAREARAADRRMWGN